MGDMDFGSVLLVVIQLGLIIFLSIFFLSASLVLIRTNIVDTRLITELGNPEKNYTAKEIEAILRQRDAISFVSSRWDPFAMFKKAIKHLNGFLNNEDEEHTSAQFLDEIPAEKNYKAKSS